MSKTVTVGASNQIHKGNYASTIISPSAIAGASLPEQMELFPPERLMFDITRATNGHVIRVAKGEGMRSETWVVADDQKLTDVIAAAIVAHYLGQSK